MVQLCRTCRRPIPYEAPTLSTLCRVTCRITGSMTRTGNDVMCMFRVNEDAGPWAGVMVEPNGHGSMRRSVNSVHIHIIQNDLRTVYYYYIHPMPYRCSPYPHHYQAHRNRREVAASVVTVISGDFRKIANYHESRIRSHHP
jgi:hypothetical protein